MLDRRHCGLVAFFYNAGFYGTVGGVLQGSQRAATLLLHVFGFRRQIPQGTAVGSAACGRQRIERKKTCVQHQENTKKDCIVGITERYPPVGLASELRVFKGIYDRPKAEPGNTLARQLKATLDQHQHLAAEKQLSIP